MQPKTLTTIGVLAVITALLVFGISQEIIEIGSPNSMSQSQAVLPTSKPNCIPTFADGGGPYYKSNAPFRQKIAPEQNNGEKLVVTGRILQSDCSTPSKDAVLDIWQANESGSYQDEWYRGKVSADSEGNYSFETVIPKGYGEGTGYRPPHIHFKVFSNNREIITSQMFFPQVRGTPGFDDAYIMTLESKLENNQNVHYGTHDIILP